MFQASSHPTDPAATTTLRRVESTIAEDYSSHSLTGHPQRLHLQNSPRYQNTSYRMTGKCFPDLENEQDRRRVQVPCQRSRWGLLYILPSGLLQRAPVRWLCTPIAAIHVRQLGSRPSYQIKSMAIQDYCFVRMEQYLLESTCPAW